MGANLMLTVSLGFYPSSLWFLPVPTLGFLFDHCFFFVINCKPCLQAVSNELPLQYKAYDETNQVCVDLKINSLTYSWVQGRKHAVRTAINQVTTLIFPTFTHLICRACSLRKLDVASLTWLPLWLSYFTSVSAVSTRPCNHVPASTYRSYYS